MKTKVKIESACPNGFLPCEEEYLVKQEEKQPIKKVIVVDIELKNYINHVPEKQQMIFPDMDLFKKYLTRCSKVCTNNFYDAEQSTYRNFCWQDNNGCIYEILNVYERKELYGSFLHKDMIGDPVLTYSCEPCIKHLIKQTGRQRIK